LDRRRQLKRQRTSINMPRLVNGREAAPTYSNLVRWDNNLVNTRDYFHRNKRHAYVACLFSCLWISSFMEFRRICAYVFVIIASRNVKSENIYINDHMHFFLLRMHFIFWVLSSKNGTPVAS